MPKRLSLLLVSVLLVLSTACHKDDLEPATFEGRWLLQSQTTFLYDGAAQLLSQTTNTRKWHYMVLTADSMTFYSAADNHRISAVSVRREQDTLRVAEQYTHTIKELTRHKLTLRTGPQLVDDTGDDYTELESSYERQ